MISRGRLGRLALAGLCIAAWTISGENSDSSENCSTETGPPPWGVHQQYRSADEAAWPEQRWRDVAAAWRATGLPWRMWTDEQLRELFASSLPELLDFYDDLGCVKERWRIMRADISAFALVYVHGGIYAELDVMPLQKFDSLQRYLASQDASMAILPAIIPGDYSYHYSALELLDTDTMIAAQPGHPFFIECLRSMARFFYRHHEYMCNRRGVSGDTMFLTTSVFRLQLCAHEWNGIGIDTTEREEQLFQKHYAAISSGRDEVMDEDFHFLRTIYENVSLKTSWPVKLAPLGAGVYFWLREGDAGVGAFLDMESNASWLNDMNLTREA